MILHSTVGLRVPIKWKLIWLFQSVKTGNNNGPLRTLNFNASSSVHYCVMLKQSHLQEKERDPNSNFVGEKSHPYSNWLLARNWFFSYKWNFQRRLKDCKLTWIQPIQVARFIRKEAKKFSRCWWFSLADIYIWFAFVQVESELPLTVAAFINLSASVRHWDEPIAQFSLVYPFIIRTIGKCDCKSQ